MKNRQAVSKQFDDLMVEFWKNEDGAIPEGFIPFKTRQDLANAVESLRAETRTNSNGVEKIRRFVHDQDELLKVAEDAAGGSLDGWKVKKPGWFESPDGKVRIEWEPGGHLNTNEGPHVTVKFYNGQRYEFVEKIFISGWENFKRTFGE